MKGCIKDVKNKCQKSNYQRHRAVFINQERPNKTPIGIMNRPKAQEDNQNNIVKPPIEKIKDPYDIKSGRFH